MKTAFLLIVLVAPLFAQNGGAIETMIGDTKERVTFHDNGKKKVQVLLKKNKAGEWVPDGTVSTWYPSGNRRATQEFRMGVRHGTWESFYDNGKQFNKLEYQDDEVTGEARHWYDTGTLQSLDKFTTKDGELHVAHIAYHPNGKESEKGNYLRKAGSKESVKTGTWKHYDEQGKLTKEEEYVDGKVAEPKKKTN